MLCTNCGAFVSEKALQCAVCGAELAGCEEEVKEEEIEVKEESVGIFICSACGAFVSAKAKKMRSLWCKL